MSALALLTAAVVGMLVLEAVGTAAFITIYVRSSDWRSPIGKHLLFYTVALLFAYSSGFIAMAWPSVPTLAAVTLSHMGFTLAVWHRVYLVLRIHRQLSDGS